SGLFVRLTETGADGFVPAATIGNDYWRHHEHQHALVGDRSGEAYRLGDAVRVRLVEAIATAGALRFEMLSEGKRDGAVARGPGAGSPFRQRLQAVETMRQIDERHWPPLGGQRSPGR